MFIKPDAGQYIQRPLMSEFNRFNEKRVRNHNVYTNEDKARALCVLMLLNNSTLATAKVTGIPTMTINDWKHRRHGIDIRIEYMAKHFATELNEAFEKILRASFEQTINDLNAGKLSAKERSFLLIYGIDKWLLLNGQATQIVAASLTAEDKRAKILELAKTLSKKESK
jgi:hypothetical protein